jgi:hypothetical protein
MEVIARYRDERGVARVVFAAIGMPAMMQVLHGRVRIDHH